MTSTIDANILIYASNSDDSRHEQARSLIRALAMGPELTYVFWPAMAAYLRVVTHPRLFATPLTWDEATRELMRLLARPAIRSGSEGPDFFARLLEVGHNAGVRGKLVHDAHIVALMQQYGVRTIYTNDRDFRRFDGIRVVDPFA